MNIHELKKLQEHAQFSPYTGTLQKPDVHLDSDNPLCGDVLGIDIKVKNKKIIDARFAHRGCALSGASASIFCEHIIGKSIATLSKITAKKHLASLGVPVSPGRFNCALLPLRGITTGQKKKRKR